jgi:hypothetical protein
MIIQYWVGMTYIGEALKSFHLAGMHQPPSSVNLCDYQEVVYATTAELARLPYDGLAEGFYLVGSGNTGVAASLATIGKHWSIS